MTSSKELIDSLYRFRENLSNAVLDCDMAGTAIFNNVLDELDCILEEYKDPIEIDPTYLANSLLIDRLGLAFSVIRLHQDGFTESEISQVITNQVGQEITVAEVRKWLESNNNNLDFANPRAVRGSIFDTQSRMQDLFEKLYDKLEEISEKSEERFKAGKLSKDEVELEYLKEVRQLTKDGAAIVAAVSTMTRVKEFQKIVVEAIGQVSPSAQQYILRKLNEQRHIMGALLPPT